MAETVSTSNPRYFLAIDGLRLLASVNIVLFHLEGIGGFNDLQGAPAWFFRLVKGPAFHASIFFMLGGFIYATKFAAQAENFRTGQFIRKRLRELYPLHALTTAAMVLLMLLNQLHAGALHIPRLLFSAFMHLSMLWSFFPFSSYSLNRPSWALSAFFLCYLLFGPTLRLVNRIRSTSLLWILVAMCLVVSTLWGVLYAALGAPERAYQFFHGFGVTRFFEFLIGMFLARIFTVRRRIEPAPKTLLMGLRCDLVIVASVGLVYMNLYLHQPQRPLLEWISYHVLMVPIYIAILYHLAIEQGLIARLLSVKIVRQVGTSSFYPYLIHIPLISLVTFLCENYFDYPRFLHAPRNVIVFTVLLYGASAVYANKFRKRRPKTAPLPVPVPEQAEIPVEASA